MNRACRRGCVPLIAVASLSLGVATTANAATALSIGATGSAPGVVISALYGWQYTHNFWAEAVDGAVTAIQAVDYPASIGISPAMSMDESIKIGMAALDASIRAATGKLVIVCESQGCVAATELLKAYQADAATAPSLDDVIFVFVGNPSAPTGVAAKNAGVYEPTLQITYPGVTPDWVNAYMFTREFDFFAYTPDNVDDPLVALNYAASFLTVHPVYGVVDPAMLDPNTWVKMVANTVYFVIPTLTAPLLIPFESVFRDQGLGEMFDTLNTQMLELLRTAYASNLDGYVRLGDLPADELPTAIEVAPNTDVSSEGQVRSTGSAKASNISALAATVTADQTQDEVSAPAAAVSESIEEPAQDIPSSQALNVAKSDAKSQDSLTPHSEENAESIAGSTSSTNPTGKAERIAGRTGHYGLKTPRTNGAKDQSAMNDSNSSQASTDK